MNFNDESSTPQGGFYVYPVQAFGNGGVLPIEHPTSRDLRGEHIRVAAELLEEQIDSSLALSWVLSHWPYNDPEIRSTPRDFFRVISNVRNNCAGLTQATYDKILPVFWCFSWGFRSRNIIWPASIQVAPWCQPADVNAPLRPTPSCKKDAA